MLAGLPYLGGGAVWDDHTLIAGRLVGLDGGGLAHLWVAPVTASGPGSGYYRPLALVVMALLARLGWPALHVAAMLLHAGSSVLLARLVGGRRGAMGAAVFGLHPVASEVLGWASALPDALAVHFGLWAVIAARRRPLAATALVLAAGMCKETGLLLMPFAILAGLVPARRAGIAWLWGGFAMGICRALAGVGMAWTGVNHLSSVSGAILWSVGMLVWPWPLTAVRDLRAMPAWGIWPGVALLAAGVVVAIRVPGERRRAAWAGLGLIVAGPVLALPPILHGYLAAERYLYPSSVGLAWMVGAAVPERRDWPLLRALGAALVVAALSVHIRRAPDWRNDVALFSAAARAMPDSSYAWHLLGVVLEVQGRPDEAAWAYARAIETGHPPAGDHLALLRSLVEAGRPEQALERARQGPRTNLTADYLAWWARAARDAGDLDQARRILAPLRRPDGGWHGPSWVGPLAMDIGLQASGSSDEPAGRAQPAGPSRASP